MIEKKVSIPYRDDKNVVFIDGKNAYWESFNPLQGR